MLRKDGEKERNASFRHFAFSKKWQNAIYFYNDDLGVQVFHRVCSNPEHKKSEKDLSKIFSLFFYVLG